MVTISRAINASQAKKYHKEEFANSAANYYTQESTVRGTWCGQLAARWGLDGEVSSEQFARLSEGQHPVTGVQLVRHKAKSEYVNDKGETVRSMDHRAGFDATFSAPKSVSLSALVGGDTRVRQAHRESVRVAAAAMEQYVQARMSDAPAESTSAWVAVSFEHDSSRPAEGYAAPQLHTHMFIANIAESADGKTHSLQPRELYRSQQYSTSVYRAELTVRLKSLGYEIERGAHAQPEIRGYTAEFLRAASPRRQQIEEEMREKGVFGARAAQLAALSTRESKRVLPREEVLEQHRQMAQLYGNQPQRVVAEAELRPGVEIDPERSRRSAREAMAQACERNMERTAVADERDFMRDALKHAMGTARLPHILDEFERYVADGKLILVQRTSGTAAREFTTPEMQSLEREVIQRMLGGRDNHTMLVSDASRVWAADRHPHLSESQLRAIQHILMSCDLFTALDGRAGVGKTTCVHAIREAAEASGYEVKGLAPTARAARNLAEAQVETETLQMHLTRGEGAHSAKKRLYIVDESSLVSTQQMHMFIGRLKAGERVLWMGDVGQHEAVDAGRPYAQLQENEMRTARLHEILRQRDPALRAVVEQLADGNVREAIAELQNQGCVHEIEDYDIRIRAIASEYMRHPEGTLVISPDNQSRREINECIHRAMLDECPIRPEEHTVQFLQQRQEMTGADRLFAQNYELGDVLRYQKSSKAYDLKTGELAKVESLDTDRNTLTVRRNDGGKLTYDPRRMQGVTVYRETERVFAAGDRIQFTAAYKARKLANRDLGTIEKIDEDGNVKLRLDDKGLKVTLNVRHHPFLDHGFAVTSFSSQGETAERVLIHADSEFSNGLLLNQRFAYVSISRAREAAHIFTNDASSLGFELSRDVSKSSALQQNQSGHGFVPPEMMDEIMPKQEYSVKGIEPIRTTGQEFGRDVGLGI